MRLEERDSQVQFEHDAAYRPHIARLCPSQFKNDLGSSVVSRRNDSAMVFVVECCAAEINEANVGTFDTTDFPVLE